MGFQQGLDTLTQLVVANTRFVQVGVALGGRRFAPPVLFIFGDARVSETNVYTLNLSASDPGDDTITQWTIDWGDGPPETFPGNSTSVTHVYADGPLSLSVSATATDEDGTPSATAFGSLLGGTSRNATNVPGAVVLLDQDNAASSFLADPTTGDFRVTDGLSGLAQDSQGTLFGSTASRVLRDSGLLEIDPLTGELIQVIGRIRIWDTEPLQRVKDLAIQPGTDVLYALTTPGGLFDTVKLYSIDKATAVATFGVDTGVFFRGGPAFAPDGTLYMNGFISTVEGISRADRDPALFVIDPESGAVISSALLHDDTGTLPQIVFDGMVVRPSDGTIFATGNFGSPENSADLVATAAPDGFVSIVGNPGGQNVSDMEFRRTPEG